MPPFFFRTCARPCAAARRRRSKRRWLQEKALASETKPHVGRDEKPLDAYVNLPEGIIIYIHIYIYTYIYIYIYYIYIYYTWGYMTYLTVWDYNYIYTYIDIWDYFIPKNENGM